jgi:hypothetical protein
LVSLSYNRARLHLCFDELRLSGGYNVREEDTQMQHRKKEQAQETHENVAYAVQSGGVPFRKQIKIDTYVLVLLLLLTLVLVFFDGNRLRAQDGFDEEVVAPRQCDVQVLFVRTLIQTQTREVFMYGLPRTRTVFVGFQPFDDALLTEDVTARQLGRKHTQIQTDGTCVAFILYR